MTGRHRNIVRLGTAMAAFALLMPAIGASNAAFAAGAGTAVDRFNAARQAQPNAITSLVNVTPSSMNGWAFGDDNGAGTGGGSMVTGPATPPVGPGSANLFVTTSNAGWLLGTAAYQGTRLDQFSNIIYSAYGNSNVQALAFAFDVEYDMTAPFAGYRGRLVYEPYLSGGAPVQANTWQTWTPLTGKWWASNAFGQTACPQSNPCTTAQLFAAFPNVGVRTPGAVLFKAGSGWTNFTGNVDSLSIVTTGPNASNQTYNFDPNPVADAYGHLVPQASSGPGYEAYATEAYALAGTRLNLDLKLNSGNPNNKITVAQNYLGFDSSKIGVVDANSSMCSPTPSTTLNGDTTTFDTGLQNQVCNGPGGCAFAPAGSVAYASGTFGPGVSGDFRVAQMGLCTAGLGTTNIAWQFDQANNRNSFIEDELSNRVNSNAAYTGYTVHVVQPQLVGHVTFQGVPQPSASNAQPITLTVKSASGELNFNTTPDASGFFTVSLGTSTPGSYSWRVKGSRYLANSGSFTLNSATVITRISVNNSYSNGYTDCASGCLRGGDSNNDNHVDASDFNILRNTFGKSVGDVGYDARADYDNNGTVDGSDFNILKSNFGTSGVGPI